MALNARQRAFVREFLVDRNAAAAARRAGYEPRTARQVGGRLRTNVDVAAAIDAAERDAAARAEVSLDWAIANLKRESLLPDADGGSSTCRIRATELIAKHLGLRTRVEVEHSGAVTLAAELADIAGRGADDGA